MRAAAGWPLGSPNRQYDAVMTNTARPEINHIDSLAEDEIKNSLLRKTKLKLAQNGACLQAIQSWA